MEKILKGEFRNDGQLTAGFIENDRKCMEEIYSRNYRTVEQYILKNSGSHSDAKDIYQEAIVAAWMNVKEGKFEVKTDKSIGGYIFQIAKYKWLDRIKSKAYRSTMRIINDEHHQQDSSDGGYNEEEENRIKYLNKLYSSLDEKCRAILNRFYYEKKSLDEIGDELNYDAGTVKTLKYRCMKKLKSFHNSQQNQQFK